MDTQDKEQNQEQENQIEDERLSYVLITLNLEDLIRLFIDNNINLWFYLSFQIINHILYSNAVLLENLTSIKSIYKLLF